MIFRSFCILICIFSIVHSDDSEPKPKDTSEYNLVKCMFTALENNSACKKATIDKKIADIEWKASSASFEWMLNSTTSYSSYSESYEVVSQSLGVSKNFVTGTEIGFTTQVTDRSSILKDKGSSFVFNLSQELLAGASVKENELPIYRAKIRSEQSNNRLEDQIRATLFRVSSNFFQYIKNEETIKINTNALKQSQKFLETVKELKKAGKGTNLDIATAEVQVATREESVLRSKTNINNSLDTLKRSMGIEMDKEIIVIKDISLDVILPELDYEKAFQHAFNNRPDVMNSKLNLELINRELIVKTRGKKPNLTLNYSATFAETEDDYVDAYHYSDNPEHSLSLRFSMPLERKRKIAEYLSAKLLSEKSELELWDLTQDIKLDIKRILREIEESIKTLEVQKQRLSTEEIRVQSFETRFENGLIDSLEVTRAYDDLDKARIDLINSKLNLKTLIAEYHVVIGSQPMIIMDNEKKLLEKQNDK